MPATIRICLYVCGDCGSSSQTSSPIAVAPILLAFRFTLRETLLVSAVGLKGAVPIVLAIYPLLYGLPDAITIFNVVFFVVLVSALTQGWSLPLVMAKGKPVPPVVTGGAFRTREDEAVEVRAEASDVDGDALTFRVTKQPKQGSVEVLDKGAGRFRYTPRPDAFGGLIDRRGSRQVHAVERDRAHAHRGIGVGDRPGVHDLQRGPAARRLLGRPGQGGCRLR